MDSVRWGVIGAGDVCERKSGPPLYRVPRSELALVYRRDRERGEDFARRHAGRYVDSLDALLRSDEVDAVYVASPHELHAEQTIAALEAGKHVLVEKPMALSAADCTRMIDAAAGSSRSLAVAYYRRGYPSMPRLRGLIDDRAIGTPTAMSINSEFPTSHRLDLVHYLLGDITAVRALPGSTSGYRFERVSGRIQARVDRREGPVVVTMTDTWTETGMPESILVTGSEGRIFLTDLKAGELLIEGSTDDDGGGKAPSPWEQVSVGGLPFTHWGLVENFVAHLLDGASLACDGLEGRKSTLVLDALETTDGSGEWVSI